MDMILKLYAISLFLFNTKMYFVNVKNYLTPQFLPYRFTPDCVMTCKMQ